MELSFAKLRELWEKLERFDILFNFSHKKDFGLFVSSFVRQVGEDQYESTGLFWEVDDVGILYLTDIAPGYEAKAHFTFWDRRFRGREELIKAMILYSFKMLQLHRMNVEVPVFIPALLGFAERLGFTKEGRRRETVFYRDKWFDSVMYSLLRREVEDGVQSDGSD